MIVRFRFQQPTLLQAIRDVPSTSVVWEDMNFTDEGSVILLFWVESDDFDAFEVAMDNDPTVDSPRCLTTFSDRRLYQAKQIGEGRAKSAYSALVDTGAIIQRCIATKEGWTMQIAFPSQEALQEYYALCERHEMGFTLLEKYEQSDDSLVGGFGLTEKQQQMIVLAQERGYFEVPRRTDLDGLATELDISHQAASERLRRAIGALVGRSVSALASEVPQEQ